MSHKTWWKKFVNCFNRSSDTFEHKKDFKKACETTAEKREFIKLRTDYFNSKFSSRSDRETYDRMRRLGLKLNMTYKKTDCM